jgi:hypothetical protein
MRLSLARASALSGRLRCWLIFLTAFLGVLPLGARATTPGMWHDTGSMNVPRVEQTATLLRNGLVLVAGGEDSSTPRRALASAELYEPATGRWSLTGSMNVARAAHTATLLANGEVLVAGGATLPGSTASAERYDPASGVWSMTGTMNQPRGVHTATLLGGPQCNASTAAEWCGHARGQRELGRVV